jgi:hypothetical protein
VGWRTRGIGLLRTTALVLPLVMNAGACGNVFSSLIRDAEVMLLEPSFGRRGQRLTVVASFPSLRAELVAGSRFTSLDFGERVFVTALRNNEDGTIDLTLRIDPTAPLGRRVARAILETAEGDSVVAAAEFVVLTELAP